MLTFDNVSHRYRDVPVLRGVTLQLEPGRVVALLGANGAGKSTFIHLAAGVLTPTSGAVGRRCRRVGWCAQRQIIDWFVSVRDNVWLGARLAGLSGSAADRATDEALTAVGLDELAGRGPEELSGGQQQRVMIARALVTDAPLLLLDEPMVGLDVASTEFLVARLRGRAARGDLVVVSSHELESLETAVDDIVLLDRGTLAFAGPRGQFLDRFAGTEILQLTLASDVPSPELVSRLAAFGDVLDSRPLTVRLCRGAAMGAVVRLAETHDTLIDIHRRTPTLREAVLSAAGTQLEMS